MSEQPKTAYELLERVCEHIVEEPKRYHQGVWALLGGRIADALGKEAAPACGTVCCRAGWIVALHDGLNAKPLQAESNGVRTNVVEERAQSILDLSEDATLDLFDGSALEIEQGLDKFDDDGEYDGPELPRRGTLEYAQLGADGLRKFMTQHESHLKARLLADVPKLENSEAAS